jgi:hypothetical protein
MKNLRYAHLTGKGGFSAMKTTRERQRRFSQKGSGPAWPSRSNDFSVLDRV